MKTSRESWLALGLILLLIILAIIAAFQEASSQGGMPLSTHSSQSNGARALWLWLQALDYRVSREGGDFFAIPQKAEVALLLEPTFTITDEAWERYDRWVADGGTLIVAGDRLGTQFAAQHFDFRLIRLQDPIKTLTAQSPLWITPPLTDAVHLQAKAYLETDRQDFVAHFAHQEKPVLVSFPEGRGQVFLCATPFPFSNAGLKAPGNPALMLNLLQAAGGTPELIWFDAWHQGFRDSSARGIGPGAWLRGTPSGHALLYAALILFVAIAMQGQNFGRPVPLPRDIHRRAPIEYITAIANLRRRTGHRSVELRYYHDHLKRELGRRYRLNPRLRDPEYVANLKALDARVDAKALSHLLTRLSRADVSESEMIQLAKEASEWIASIKGQEQRR